MYFLLKPILFKFDPEKVHYFVTRNLKRFNRFPGGAALSRAIWAVNDPRLEREVFGLKFKNPVGLAAGFDKNADVISEMANLGFGFIEVGTVTPLPQDGNPKPRMFRLPTDGALINRMGFNNMGMDVVANRLKTYRRDVKRDVFSGKEHQKGIIIGGNIGKNKVTPNEDAVNDYI